ncbi:MAG: AbrB/MazE/SpoVT family DNA-binding domain-containing protein [bacterium]|nr:AbrB/MazE/SpoVT family DNA-binding domain-containing protein [bacterium]
MTTTVLTTKGQVVIPAAIRKQMGIAKGAHLSIEQKGGEIVLKPVDGAFFAGISESFNTKGRLTKALIKERARDRKRESGK